MVALLAPQLLTRSDSPYCPSTKPEVCLFACLQKRWTVQGGPQPMWASLWIKITKNPTKNEIGPKMIIQAHVFEIHWSHQMYEDKGLLSRSLGGVRGLHTPVS